MLQNQPGMFTHYLWAIKKLKSCCFDAMQSWLRDPDHLRAAITSEDIDVRNNPLVSFVTLDAYETSGGFVRHGCFGDTQNANTSVTRPYRNGLPLIG